MATASSIVNARTVTQVTQKINISSGIVKLKGVTLIVSDAAGGLSELQVGSYNNELFVLKGTSWFRIKNRGDINIKLQWREFRLANGYKFEYQVGGLGWLLLKLYEKA